MQVQCFPLVSDAKIGTWGIPLVKLSWSRFPSLKKANHPESVTLDMLHTSIILKYQLPQLVGNRSCLFSPCSVGCSHSCETVKCFPRGSTILLCKWIQKCDILLAGTGGAYESLTAMGLPDGLTPITAEPNFIDFALSPLQDDLLQRGMLPVLFFPLIPFVYFLKKKKKSLQSASLISANYRLQIRQVN